MTLRYLLSIIAILSFSDAFSQNDSMAANLKKEPLNNTETTIVDSTGQRDLIDIIQKILDKTTSSEKRKSPKKANFSIIPYAGYTLSTGFTADISGNVGFYIFMMVVGIVSILMYLVIKF